MTEFVTEIQSQHFGGNNYWLIKGVALECYKKYYNKQVLTKQRVDPLIGEFNSFLSYDSRKVPQGIDPF